MNLPRSSFYYKPKAQERSPEDRDLEKRIEEITEEFTKYGYRKVTKQLHDDGIPVNHKKVHRIMREKGLLVKKRRRFVKTRTAIIRIPYIRT
jgi:transposase InsO family protein